MTNWNKGSSGIRQFLEIVTWLLLW